MLRRINEILDRRWLSNNGPIVQEFEPAIAERLGVQHCVAMCNGTVALEIAIRALGLKAEVIVPSFTFIATAHALQWQEITPVFCDVDPATHNLDPAAVERMITPRTTGIIGVHLWGRPCAVEALQELADRHDLTLMFDAAHAFGCSHGGRMIGNFGRCEVFSFHATKFFNTFEGGAVVTNDDELAAKIRLMKNFGFAGYDNVIYLGTNGKMTEVCAAMGLTGLESLRPFIAVNRRNHEAYRRGCGTSPGSGCWNTGGDDAELPDTSWSRSIRTSPLTRDELVRRAARRERPGPPVLLSRLPSHGAVPLATFRTPASCCRRRPASPTGVVVLPTGTAVTETDVRERVRSDRPGHVPGHASSRPAGRQLRRRDGTADDGSGHDERTGLHDRRARLSTTRAACGGWPASCAARCWPPSRRSAGDPLRR